jgi:undecaprenyl-diphosphatase
MSHLTYAEAMVVGLLQGVTELFPVSSLGHSVLIPALVGGQWAQDLNVSAPESPYLAFIVGLHVATALAMIIYFWRDWVRIVTGFLTSLRDRQIATADQKLAWMILLATIPVGIAGLALEHLFRVVFSKPVPTAFFLAVNGVVLLAGERRRRRSGERGPAPRAGLAGGSAREEAVAAGSSRYQAQGAYFAPGIYPAQDRYAAQGGYPASGAHRAGLRAGPAPGRERETDSAVAADRRLATIGYGKAIVIGATQVFALLPGISRDGIVTVTGMFRGLTREDAVRFSFLLSAPVILAAGVLKIPDLFGPLGAGIHGQVLVGSLLSGLGAYFSVRFLVRYFSKARSLTPFAIYCLAAGLGSLVYLVLR